MVDTGKAPPSGVRHQPYYVAGLIDGEPDAADNSAEVDGLRAVLREQLALLPSLTGEAVLLHHGGMSYRNIGTKLGISKSAAHRIVREGMDTLRENLGQFA
jgi:DNA-directed RNA polymerase specialized sigma24 family protein